MSLLPRSGTPAAHLVQMRDKPDAEIELEDCRHVGVEVTELLMAADGRDRYLESFAASSIREVVRELLGPHGWIDVQLVERPRDHRQVGRWTARFRRWVMEVKASILDEGGVYYGQFPPPAVMAKATLAAMQRLGVDKRTLAEQARLLDELQDLAWLRLESIHLTQTGGWHFAQRPGGDHLAERHQHEIDDMVVESVALKCRKAVAYDVAWPLWCLVRNPYLTEPTDDVPRRLEQLPGIERFAQVWLVNLVQGRLDIMRPPTCRRVR